MPLVLSHEDFSRGRTLSHQEPDANSGPLLVVKIKPPFVHVPKKIDLRKLTVTCEKLNNVRVAPYKGPRSCVLGKMRFLLPLALLVVSAEAFHVPVPFPIQSGARTSMLPVLRCSLPSPSGEDANGNLERRQVLWKAAAAAAAVGVPTGAFAVDDKVVSKFATQAPPTDKDGQPFIQLESGASYRYAETASTRPKHPPTPHPNTNRPKVRDRSDICYV
eukprot:135682-Rhodomonas_salina.2